MRRVIFVLILLQNICFAQFLAPHFGGKIGKQKPKQTQKESSKDTIASTNSINKNEASKSEKCDSCTIIFYGSTALNGTGDNLIDNLTATGRLAVAINFPFRARLNIGANLVNANPRKGIKKDSVDFNSLMFPETGNFGFLFNPSFILFNEGPKGSSFNLNGTYAFRKVMIDSPNIVFKISTVNIGLQYTWRHNSKDNKDQFIFSIMPYWNAFVIPNEDVRKFDSLVNDSLFEKNNKKAIIYSYGAKTTIQFKNFLFFADLRRNLHTVNFSDDNPLKGTKFNIGFMTFFTLKAL